MRRVLCVGGKEARAFVGAVAVAHGRLEVHADHHCVGLCGRADVANGAARFFVRRVRQCDVHCVVDAEARRDGGFGGRDAANESAPDKEPAVESGFEVLQLADSACAGVQITALTGRTLMGLLTVPFVLPPAPDSSMP